MIEFCERVLSYTSGMDQEEFVADTRTYDATLRNLELVGEAGKHVPSRIREAHPAIPWREIIALRNRLIHVYLGVDKDVLWDIIKNDVPNLVDELRTLVEVERGAFSDPRGLKP